MGLFFFVVWAIAMLTARNLSVDTGYIFTGLMMIAIAASIHNENGGNT